MERDTVRRTRRSELALAVGTVLFIGAFVLAAIANSVVPVVIVLGLFSLVVWLGY